MSKSQNFSPQYLEMRSQFKFGSLVSSPPGVIDECVLVYVKLCVHCHTLFGQLVSRSVHTLFYVYRKIQKTNFLKFF